MEEGALAKAQDSDPQSAELVQPSEDQNRKRNVPNSENEEHQPKYIIHGLDRYTNKSKLEKFLKSIGVSFHRVKKPASVVFAHISFENEAQKEDAFKKLQGLDYKGRKLEIKESNRKAVGPPSKKVKQTDDEVPTDVRDVVTPLFRIPYEEQIKLKEKETRNILTEMSRKIRESNKSLGEECPLEFVLPSPVVEGYRNKVNFTVGSDNEGKLCIGHQLGRTQDSIATIGDPTECMNIPEVAKKIRTILQDHMRKSPFDSFNKFTKQGFWRMVTIRTNQKGEAMVLIQARTEGTESSKVEEEKKNLVDLGKAVQGQGIRLISLLWQEWNGISNAAPSDCPFQVVLGEEHIYELLCGLSFRINPNSFFQINTLAAEVLYNTVKSWSKLDNETTLLDVCCGTGTIGLTMAKDVEKVIGIEIIEDAIKDAKFNAELNGIFLPESCVQFDRHHEHSLLCRKSRNGPSESFAVDKAKESYGHP
eukprot:TRINITY_DN8718_c0_g1_i2.p1 TRINITY_DN8718_c0_g1~~TRINITY_DN8718_c0_g1_i2.p1  ORF type:complete len:477 (-),score=77.95 TRINITY_DN8718_c0_g1_i2:305-1735(-)